jgi:hypothetical protein
MVGAWAWTESRLYEVTGSWVPSTLWPAAKVWFGSVSQHHAWRARLWHERLPGRLVPAYSATSRDRAASGLVRPGGDGAEAALEALARLHGDGARLAAYCRVILPRTVVAYRSWQRRCTASSDRPVARALALNLVDVVADWQEGSELLADLLDRPGGADDLDEVAAASAGVERALMGQGLVGQGLVGQGLVGQGPVGQGPVGQGPVGQGPVGQGLGPRRPGAR